MENQGDQWEELKVTGDQLVSTVKRLVHEGNVRRIVLKNESGETFIEIPLTAGVVGADAAAALGGPGRGRGARLGDDDHRRATRAERAGGGRASRPRDLTTRLRGVAFGAHDLAEFHAAGPQHRARVQLDRERHERGRRADADRGREDCLP